MSDIDLTPRSHRQGRFTRRSLLRFAVLYLLFAVALAAAKLALGTRIEQESAAVDRLRSDKTSVLAQRAELARLHEREKLLSQELKTLRTLGAESAVGRVFDSVDRALDEGVWFTDWSFMRAGEFIEAGPRSVDTGYLIVVQREAGGDSREKAWRMNTHMEIRGQAMSHSALASFVQRLTAMPAVHEVKILTTNVQAVDALDVIAFELAVIVNEAGTRA